MRDSTSIADLRHIFVTIRGWLVITNGYIHALITSDKLGGGVPTKYFLDPGWIAFITSLLLCRIVINMNINIVWLHYQPHKPLSRQYRPYLFICNIGRNNKHKYRYYYWLFITTRNTKGREEFKENIFVVRVYSNISGEFEENLLNELPVISNGNLNILKLN